MASRQWIIANKTLINASSAKLMGRRSEPGDLVDLLARRDCGSAEFQQVREYLKDHGDSAFLNRLDFMEWVLAHRDAIKMWAKD